MDNENAKLDALTNQRVQIKLGDKTYSARRMTAFDFARLLRYIKERGGDYQDIADNFEANLYLISLLIKPDIDITPEQLGDSIPFGDMSQITEALEKVGLNAPQLQNLTTK